MKSFLGWGSSVIGVCLCITMLTGCRGYKFNDVPFNESPSADMAKRSVYEDGSIIRYRTNLLIGLMLYRSKAGEWRRGEQIVGRAPIPDPQPIVDGKVFETKVDKNFTASGGGAMPIFTFAGELATNAMSEVLVIDQNLIAIEPTQIPWERLKEEAKRAARADDTGRFWVQAVMLTDVLRRTVSSSEGSTTVSGVAFGAKGSVFSGGTTFQRAPIITMLLIDIDRLAKEIATLEKSGEVNPKSEDLKRAIEAATATHTVRGAFAGVED